ncbi:MAG TPA: YebC/PmpR family DNA-binding transcriptional regulator [Bacteroidetes bacterium]|nr:YebC/PmpR family DNA-binding transcriptional regulator [Bacteroidota bacterium]
MSGHNKWSTIKRKKGAADARRSKIFSRIAKEITIAVKEGGGADPEFNPRLRLAVQNAKGANMPKDNIERAIHKGQSDTGGLQEVTYEGYAPGGVGIFVECMTDNTNRTVGNIRSIFNKRGGNLGTNGSLSFLFDRKGVFAIPKEGLDAEEFALEVIDAGAEDFQEEEDYFVVYTVMEDFGKVQKKLEEMGVVPENAELRRIPNTLKKLDPEEAMKVLRMIDDFEEDDDVQNVYHNLELTEEILQKWENS